MALIVALVFLIASFVMAIVNRGVGVGDLALWAIASALILPKFIQ